MAAKTTQERYSSTQPLLVARATRAERRGSLLFGAMLVFFSCFVLAGALFYILLLRPAPGFLMACLVILPFFSLIAGLLPYKQLILGDLYSGVIVNSRTIAIRRRRGPVRFLKRRDCIGCGELGRSLWFADGKRYSILVEDAYGLVDHTERFLEPFYASWWPETTLEHLGTHRRNTFSWRRFALNLLFLFTPFIFLAVISIATDVPWVLFGVPLLISWYLTQKVATWLDLDGSRAYTCPLPIPTKSLSIPEARHAED